MSLRFRIATFNLENLDDKPGELPTLDQRIAVMRPQLVRLRADILCLQEVNGQEQPGQDRRLLALDRLFADTQYAGFNRASTLTQGGEVYDERNLVVVSRFPILDRVQLKHDLAPAPRYRKVTAVPPETEDKEVTWERPILHVQIQLDANRVLHVVNLHLKSRLPSNIAGQKINNFTWRSSSGWAEGFFISSMKRVGQALETRMLVDGIFDQDPAALIVVCGDFNADVGDVPMAAIVGEVEETGNGDLAPRALMPAERTVAEPSRFSLYHRGKGQMLDHLIFSRTLLGHYRHSEIHNEMLHDESMAFATDKKFPESDHAPVVAELVIPD